MSSWIGQFRRKIQSGDYELTHHAVEEMLEDGFTIHDVKSAIMTGRIIMRQSHGVSRQKFVILGRAEDGRSMRIVCRLTSLGLLRVITVFADVE